MKNGLSIFIRSWKPQQVYLRRAGSTPSVHPSWRYRWLHTSIYTLDKRLTYFAKLVIFENHRYTTKEYLICWILKVKMSQQRKKHGELLSLWVQLNMIETRGTTATAQASSGRLDIKLVNREILCRSHRFVFCLGQNQSCLRARSVKYNIFS